MIATLLTIIIIQCGLLWAIAASHTEAHQRLRRAERTFGFSFDEKDWLQ